MVRGKEAGSSHARAQAVAFRRHGLVKGSLVGLGNAISDGSLVVYYPHLLVLPEFQERGIGRQLMKRLMKRYRGFHQHILVAEGKAVSFYRKCGFKRAGKTASMWVFKGTEHG